MSATTSVDHEGLMMRAQIGVQKSTEKIRGNWGAKKGCFWRGRREGIKQRRLVYVNAWTANVCFISQSYRFIFIDCMPVSTFRLCVCFMCLLFRDYVKSLFIQLLYKFYLVFRLVQ